jgi:hypothetical protein
MNLGRLLPDVSVLMRDWSFPTSVNEAGLKGSPIAELDFEDREAFSSAWEDHARFIHRVGSFIHIVPTGLSTFLAKRLGVD